MKYTLIEEKGQYALILRGESMTQYAVVSGLDKKAGSWDWTCCYYDFGEFSGLTRAEALFKALDYYLMRTNEKYISWTKMSEIATVLKDGLIEDNEEDAYRYLADTLELSDTEAEYFGLDIEQYRDVTDKDTDNHQAPSSTYGDNSPANSWDAPEMSVLDFMLVSPIRSLNEDVYDYPIKDKKGKIIGWAYACKRKKGIRWKLLSSTAPNGFLVGYYHDN